MRMTTYEVALLLLVTACSGQEAGADGEASQAASSDEGGDVTAVETDPSELSGSGAEPEPLDESLDESLEAAEAPGDDWVQFVDPVTGTQTGDVHDADREVMHFDAERSELVWALGEVPIPGWSVSAQDLDWSNSSVAFQVLFGTEEGERRAYFTETRTGTICNLSVSESGALSIAPTAEPPPSE